LETADTLYLYLLTNHGDFYPVHPIPPPQQAVVLPPVRGTEAGQPPPAPPWTRQIHPLLDQAFQKVSGFMPAEGRDPGSRPAATFRALNELGEVSRRIPGPKTIVWITAGVSNWPTYPYGCKDINFPEGPGSFLAGKCTDQCRRMVKCVDYAPFFQHFSAELRRTDTLIYAAEDIPTGSIPSNSRGTPEDTLRQLTNLTGGRMYTGNSVDKAIIQALQNARARYELAYASPHSDGKYHKLRVTCARQGVHVEAPRGYFGDQQ